MTDLFTPFAPDADEAKKRLFRPVSFRVIVPNMITLGALCLGLTAIRLAYEGRWAPAVYAILIAAVLDGIDGRVARLLKGTSRFGAELDSLADFVSFGVAPALLLYSFSLSYLKSIGWIVALILAMSMGLRLARFNAMIDAPNRPDWQKNFFTGVPAPAGAMLSLLPLYLFFIGIPFGERMAIIVSLYTLIIAFLTICTLPIYSGKTLGSGIPRSLVLPIFIVTVVFLGLLLSFPFPVLAGLALAYLASIPVGVRRFRAIGRAEAMKAAAMPEPDVGEAVSDDLAKKEQTGDVSGV